MNRGEVIFKYVLANFNLKYEVAEDLLKIDYGVDSGAKISIDFSGLTFFNKSENVADNEVLYREWKGNRVPFFFGNRSAEVITKTAGCSVINVDIIAGAFYFLSGWQEQFVSKKDKYGRYPYVESIQKKLDIATFPVVNYYFDILKTAIEDCYNVSLVERISEKFVVNLSHDIDELDTIWLQEGYHAMKKGKLMAMPKIALEKILSVNKTNPTLSRILNFEKTNKHNSDFFFLCKKGMDGLYKNADYDVSGAAIKAAAVQIIDEGSAIGIHGSFHTHNSSENLKGDINTLEAVTGRKIEGNRFHFLSYDCMNTPAVLEANNILYDSTLGFAEHIGFRNSYANVFYLFNLKNFLPTKIMEFPLSLMDASLYFSQYMNLNFDQANIEAGKLINEIEKVNGLLVINWHNTGYLKYKNNWLQLLLTEIINKCGNKHGVFMTMSEINRKLSDENKSKL